MSLILVWRTQYNGLRPEILQLRKAKNSAIQSKLDQALSDIIQIASAKEAQNKWVYEVLNWENWYEKKSLNDFSTYVNPYIVRKVKISSIERDLIKSQMQDKDITSTELDAFIIRWNYTIEAWNNGITTPTQEYPNIINDEKLKLYTDIVNSVNSYILDRGYSNFDDIYTNALEDINDLIIQSQNSVCSSISLQLSQTIAMTRQAFKGTLKVLNGHETVAMKNVKLTMEVKDANGVVVGSNIMEQHTKSLDKLTAIDGTGLINAKETGTAVVEFIPTKYAAPTIPQVYSFGGTLSYIDPFTNTEVTRNLYPIKMTVKPSPDLTLTYFMERDVLGDDPLTAPIEPMYPFEFSVLVKNIGAGDATKVHIEAQEPEVIKNEKGLLSVFELKESGLNGLKRNPNPNPEEIDFGKILAGKTAYGQFWYTNTLLGHFVEYDTKLNYLTSFDNPDLSLISDVSIHELIRSVEAKTATNETVTAFMANDMPDDKDQPDMLYLADGTTDRVYAATSATITKTADNVYSLIVTPAMAGYNYGNIADPTNGRAKLVSIKRVSDNASLSLRNFWQTDRTLIDKKEPVYEYKLHFVDKFNVSASTYILTFEPKPLKVLEVQCYENVPSTSIGLQSLNIVFNKDIDASSFDADDINLKRAGISMNLTGKIVITKIAANKFTLDISKLTTEAGYYVLTVQTKNITDLENYQGEIGKEISWSQNPNSVQLTLQINPEGSGVLNYALGTSNCPYNQLVNLTVEPVAGYKFRNWEVDNNQTLTDKTLNVVTNTNKQIIANFDLIDCKVDIENDATKGSVTGATSAIYKYNSQLVLTANPIRNYKFTGWLVNDNNVGNDKTYILTVNKDLKVTPTYTPLSNIIYRTKSNNSWTDADKWQFSIDNGVTWIDNIDEPESNVKSIIIQNETLLPQNKDISTDDLVVNSNAKFDLEGTLNNNKNFIIYSDDESTGQVLNTGNVITTNSQVVLRKSFKKSNGWYFISFPFDVNFNNIKVSSNQKVATTNSFKLAVAPYNDFYVAEYNGFLRDQTGTVKATDSPNLEAVTDGVLRAGIGYALIVMSDQTFDFKSSIGNSSIFEKKGKSVNLGLYNSNPLTVHRSWNLVGNPYLSSFDINNLDQGYFYYVYDQNRCTYDPKEAGDGYKINPYSAFFMQALNPQLSFSILGRVFKAPNEKKNYYDEISLNISNEAFIDRTRVRLMENADPDFEIDKDAIKMQSLNALTPQIWTKSMNYDLAINALPVNITEIPLSLKIGSNGFYNISLNNTACLFNFKNVYLIDNVSNNQIDLLNNSMYNFSINAGIYNSRFKIKLIKDLSTKNVDNTSNDVVLSQKDRCLVFNGLCLKSQVTVFDITGKKIEEYSNVNNNDILELNALSGVYIVSVNSDVQRLKFKILIK